MSKQPAKKYHVFYAKDSSPTIGTFENIEEAQKFIKDFLKEECPDNWVDHLVVGDIFKVKAIRTISKIELMPVEPEKEENGK
jgi:hypothetical protein